jgi:hypothetical protein
MNDGDRRADRRGPVPACARRRARALPALLLAAAAVTAAVAGGACAVRRPALVDFSATPRNYQSKDYREVYERWTRHGITRLDFHTVLEAWGTYKSWDFREAYVEHYSDVYNLSDADRNALRAAQMESFKGAYEFNVTAQSTSYKWNDLEKRNSAWRVTLVDGLGHDLAPEFVKVQKLPEAYEIEFFPAMTPFTRTYAIRFVRPSAVDGKPPEFLGEESGSITLRIAGPLGRVELTWQGI